MRRLGRTVLALSGAMILGSCVNMADFEAVKRTNRNLDNTISQLNAYLDKSEATIDALRAENARLRQEAGDANWVRAQKAKLQKLIAEFEKQGGTDSVPGVTVIRDRDGGVGFRIPGAVLFGSGKATLTKAGQSVLSKLLPILKKDNRFIKVAGHTDTDKITHSKWKSNLELSCARALGVANYLKTRGFQYDRMFAVGYGSSRPAEPGKPDKAKDRRVEIFLK